MNGLFLTCILVSASAVCGHRAIGARIETLSQRLSTVGIEVGKAFSVTDRYRARLRTYTTAAVSVPNHVPMRAQRIPRTEYIPSVPALRCLLMSSPIRGPAA
jgi:hypothetical protein